MTIIPFMPKNPRLGFSYVPFQEFTNLYKAEDALKHGTIFRDLNIPFSEYKDIPIMNPFVRT